MALLGPLSVVALLGPRSVEALLGPLSLAALLGLLSCEHSVVDVPQGELLLRG